MIILALESALSACSVALFNDGVMTQKIEIKAQQHAKISLTFVEQLLDEAGIPISAIDAIAYSCGPGGFTGIRISAAIAQGIAFSENKPIIPVSSLQVIAQGVNREFQEARVMVLLDARMDQIYIGDYKVSQNGVMRSNTKDQIANICDIAQLDLAEKVIVTDLPPSIVKSNRIISNYVAQANDVAVLGHDIIMRGGIPVFESSHPVYLRQEDAWKKI